MFHHNETARASSLGQALKGPDIGDFKKGLYFFSSVHHLDTKLPLKNFQINTKLKKGQAVMVMMSERARAPTKSSRF